MHAPNKRLSKSIIEASKNDRDFKEIIRETKEPFEIRDLVLYLDSRLFIPRGKLRSKLLHDYHSTRSTGHSGEAETLNRITPKYYRKSMRFTVQE